MPRHDGRAANELRSLKLTRGYASAAAGSVLVEWGQTTVLCTASLSNETPPWLAGKGRGWVTAEYNMLPGSTSPRKARKPDGRSTEIQRLIGRSLRAGVDLAALGERTLTVDCDVLRADGGTRTASITGGWVALRDAIATIRNEDGQLLFPEGDVVGPGKPLIGSVAAVSVGLVRDEAALDLDYPEDSTAQVDMNVVATGTGDLIEVQGGGEGTTFSRAQLNAMLDLAIEGIAQITDLQNGAA
ncbi:Ribonuclease PH [Botrimarina colliarenosi]|uniref:Ribonuclease PH n=1 Tax=Botrimarina colliarenosi TaxID=2528001 RepID=A0A5C6A7Q3_9BACT|nr:ribonuclease PH [Botrimarina colliarenosi]TWT95328.1 Ribonuclease PH [Botrimarina colliarenosi]